MTPEAGPEHLDVLIVGAGLSGIAAAHYVGTDCPWATWAVVEARDDLGGTWDLFRYPGVRSDSDMFTLGYSFRPWDRPEAIASGGAILDYLRETAAAEGINSRIRFGRRVVAAAWSTAEARWTVTVEDVATGARTTLTAGFYLNCTGYYRYDHGYEPEFPGRDRYTGTFVHPQRWPTELDVTGRRVVVIGSGATAVTLVPALARTAGHVTMLQRSPSYVASVPGRSPLMDGLRRSLPRRYRDAGVRWAAALGTQAFYELSRRRPELVKGLLRRAAVRQLPAGYDVDTHFTPRYDPWDQRLCAMPDGDLFAAIGAGTASVVTDTIDTFTPTGLRLTSGQELEADVVVGATGLDLLFLGGAELSVDGVVVDPGGRLMYKGAMLDGVPNLVVVFGYTNASWTLKAELSCGYATRVLNHLRRIGRRQGTPVSHDEAVSGSSVVGLSSGYVERAAARLPKQGVRPPWLVHQSYLRDYRTTRRGPVVDGVIEFTNPTPGRRDVLEPA